MINLIKETYYYCRIHKVKFISENTILKLKFLGLKDNGKNIWLIKPNSLFFEKMAKHYYYCGINSWEISKNEGAEHHIEKYIGQIAYRTDDIHIEPISKVLCYLCLNL